MRLLGDMVIFIVCNLPEVTNYLRSIKDILSDYSTHKYDNIERFFSEFYTVIAIYKSMFSV